jgi:hypothetical protein
MGTRLSDLEGPSNGPVTDIEHTIHWAFFPVDLKLGEKETW